MWLLGPAGFFLRAREKKSISSSSRQNRARQAGCQIELLPGLAFSSNCSPSSLKAICATEVIPPWLLLPRIAGIMSRGLSPPRISTSASKISCADATGRLLEPGTSVVDPPDAPSAAAARPRRARAVAHAWLMACSDKRPLSTLRATADASSPARTSAAGSWAVATNVSEGGVPLAALRAARHRGHHNLTGKGALVG